MNIEFYACLFTVAASLVTFLGVFISESVKKKKLLGVAAVLLAIISALSAWEASERTRTKADLDTQLQRSWIILTSTPVAGLQFELVTDGGWFNYEDAEVFFSKAHFVLEDAKIDELPGLSSGLLLSTLFTREKVANNGLVGSAYADMSQVGVQGAKPPDVDCVASSYTTRQITAQLPKVEAENKQAIVCSVQVSIALPGSTSTATDLLKGKSVRIEIPNALRCVGRCRNMFLSVRLVLPSVNNLTATLIEISPMSLGALPEMGSKDTTAFLLPGDAILELGKSLYTNSFGYEDSNFAMTMGWLHRAWVKTTTATAIYNMRDVVWSTNRDDRDLRRALDPSISDRAVLLQLPDWCGFGDRPFCWHRYQAALTTTN